MDQLAFVQDDREKIELFVSCRSLTNKDVCSKSDPYLIMQQLNPQSGKWAEIGRTEVIKDNLNPNFAKSFIIDYIFEIQQQVKFQIYDYDGPSKSEFIGESNSSVSKIVGAKNQMCIYDLMSKSGKPAGKLIIRADKVVSDNNQISLKLACKKLPETRWFGKSNPFIRMHRTMENNLPIKVFESQAIMDDCNPSFSKFDIKSQKLCNGDYNMPILLEIWDQRSSGKHVFMGKTNITVNQIIQEEKKSFILHDKNKETGTLEVQQAVLVERPSFIDYIKGGTHLSLITAIDFTGSNGIPSNPQSLHYLNPGQMNQYQQAILGVGEILLNYDYDKTVPVYGFGAKPRLPQMSSNQTLHCFPVNGNSNQPEVYGLRGILDTYTQFLNHVELSGPTLFNPLIVESMKLAQATKSNSDQYHILLILTDGEIHDMEETKQSIVSASTLPLSIIIIGVGNADFTKMRILDGDSGIYDQTGKKAQRDLVQFVPYNEFKGDPALLAQHVLAELPKQLVDYKLLMGQKPNPAQAIAMSQIQVQDYPQNCININQSLAHPQQGYQNFAQPPQSQFNQPPNPQFNQPPPHQQQQIQGQYQQPQQGMNYPPGQQQYQQ